MVTDKYIINKNSKLFPLVVILGPAALLCTIIQQSLFMMKGIHILWIGWSANLIVTAASFIIMFHLIEKKSFISIINTTRSIADEETNGILKAAMFLYFMPLSMVAGTAASFTIFSNFLAGMAIYLIQHILLIVALLGIIDIRPKLILNKLRLKKTFSVIIIWALITAAGFYFLILPGLKGFFIIVVLIYILSLIVMTMITFFGLAYSARSFLFRLILCIGSTSFVISDTVIGFTTFTLPWEYSPVVTQPTWVIAIVCLQFAVLFVDANSGKHQDNN